MTEDLQKKVNRAIKLIQNTIGEGQVEVSYSGGKDSDVILELAKMSGVNYRAIYKNTTIDPPGTIKHCKDMGVEIINPGTSFFKLIEQRGMPTRRARFCCEVLKEYKVMDNAIHGIRRSESGARSRRYKETDPVICRIYGNKKNHVNVILPLLTWTDEDIAEFVKERNIQCHPLYYDNEGNFHPERRLGCMACPLKSDKGLSEYKARPKLVKATIRSLKKWMDTHQNASSVKKFRDAYGLFAHNLFYDSYVEWQEADNGLFGKTDWKEFLQRYFNIEL